VSLPRRTLALVLPALLALVMFVSPVARAATAGFSWGTIECCCGEHAGDESCGCKDCPAAVHDEEQDDHDDDAPPAEGGEMTACGPQAQLVVFAPGAAIVMPTFDLAREPVETPLDAPPEPPPLEPIIVEPETPPF
jgi:hypothetical protein